MTYNKFQIYGILKDYFWMLREIQRIDKELMKTDFRGTAAIRHRSHVTSCDRDCRQSNRKRGYQAK
jgi:hypothetical protein